MGSYPKPKPIEIDKSSKGQIAWEGNKTLQHVVRNLAAAGFQEEQISQFIGVRLGNLRKRLNKIPELREELVKGKDEATQIMVATMFQTAVGGNVYQEISETINAKGQKSVKIITKETQPNAQLMMFWLTNQAPESWRTLNDQKKDDKARLNNVKQLESDKIARLSREVFEGDTDGSKRKYTVSEETAHSIRERAINAGDLPIDVQGEATDNIQDDAVDVSAET